MASKKVKKAKLNLSAAELSKQEKAIEVELTGSTPGLLMNSAQSMLTQVKGRKHKEIPSPEDDAEVRAYRMTDKTLYIPSQAVSGCLINSAGAYKIGRKGAAQFVAGTVRVWPDQISLGTKDYKIDMRPVVVQRNRIIRARPLIEKWKASFFLIYDPTYGIEAEVLKKMLTEAGRRVGILDFRPQHRGQFGRFLITGWKEVGK
jgi:hypothetical protein